MVNVFVSYRRPDIALAERLASDLRRAGHRVWFDEWEITVGDSIVGRMTDGLEDAAYLVLCLSQHSVATPWVSREWLSALARQLNGHGVKVLPARLGGGASPAILADIKVADLTVDWGRGLTDLKRALR